MRPTHSRTAVALVALVLTTSFALADDDGETSASVTVGGQTIDGLNESSKFQEYREVPQGFYLDSFDFGFEQSGWSFDLNTVDLLQDDERVTLGVARPGKLRLTLGYDRTPKWISNTASTLYTSDGLGGLMLPLPMRQAHETFVATPDYATLADLLRTNLDASRPFSDLRYRRDTTTVGLRWQPATDWTVDTSFLQEQRRGKTPFTSSTYFSTGGDITEFALPIDYTTRNSSAAVEYAKPAFNVRAEMTYSDFTNDVGSSDGTSFYDNAFIVDNPLRATDAASGSNAAAARFLVSTFPDNKSAGLNLSGGFRVADWGRVTALYSMGRNEQNERFLPFSLNSAVPPPADPRGLVVLQGTLADGTPVTSYDGQVDTTVYDVTFSGRPLDWMSFKAFTHSYDYDNKTHEYTVTDYIRNDTGLEGIPRAALPFAWKKDNTGAELRFTPIRRFGFSVGYELEEWEREFRNTRDSSEDIFKAGIDWNPGSWGTFRATYRNGDRSYDDYDEETYFGEESYPSGEPVANAIVLEQRLFDLANREQDRYGLMAQIMPHDRFSFGLTLTRLENDYDKTTEVDVLGTPEIRSTLGRLSDESNGWAVDFTLTASDSVSIYGDYGEDTFEYDLASRYRPVTGGVALDFTTVPGDNDWMSMIEDTTKTYGLGLDATLVPDRWMLDLHGLVSDSTGKTRATFVPGGAAQGEAQDLPDVENKLTHVSARVRYNPRPDVTVGLIYAYEKYDTDDYARDVMMPWMGGVDGGAAESVFLGWRIPEYDVSLVGIQLSYRF